MRQLHHSRRPAQARSSRDRSSAAKTGTSLSGTRGGFSPAMGSGISSSAPSTTLAMSAVRFERLPHHDPAGRVSGGSGGRAA